MKIKIQDNLPYVTVSLTYRGQEVIFQRVLLDTGSASTVLSADKVLAVDLRLEPDDVVRRIRGVGGSEFVFTKRVDKLSIGELQVNNFEIEVGAMDYGLEIDGIVGMDFLLQIGANIDLAQLEIL
jgi:predicted aspartyl protease